MDYFYAAQTRKYRLQLIRAFSNFSVAMGVNADGSPKLKRVPCRYGDTSRLAETIIAGNSENKMPSAPFISVYVTNMALAPERRAAPSLVSTVNVAERSYDGSEQKYLNTQGNRYTVQRYMPVPFTMTVNVDFWTSNLTQKEELFEQTQVLFNGMVDIQTSNNPLDWTLFSTIEPTNIIWSSRTIPIGTDNPIDVMTVEYKVPIWINPPAMITYSKMIEQIVTNINEGDVDVNSMEWTSSNLLSRKITTPDDARIHLSLVSDNVYEISLRNSSGSSVDPTHKPTIITGSQSPQLLPGEAFSVNGVPITIPNTNINDLLAVMKNQFQGKNLSVSMTLNSRMQLINLNGGNLELVNLSSGAAVEGLGFAPVTYQGGVLAWWRLLEQYGTLNLDNCAGNASELLVLTSSNLDDRAHDLVGKITPHPTNQNLMYWQVSPTSFPPTTLPELTAIINPTTVWPGSGLSMPVFGQRYLLINEVALQSQAWGELTARPPIDAELVSIEESNPHVIIVQGTGLTVDRYCIMTSDHLSPQGTQVLLVESLGNNSFRVQLDQPMVGNVGSLMKFNYPVQANDVIEFDGVSWKLVFDAENSTRAELVKNQFSQKYLKFEQGAWTSWPPSELSPGEWRLRL